VNRLSVREYLREKAAESRHNEVSAYLMFIAGSILFVGGVLETLLVGELVEWVVFLPVAFTANPGSTLGLVLTLSGLALIIFGLITGIYFARDRGWYMRELSKSHLIDKNSITRRKRTKRILKSSKTRRNARSRARA